MSGNSQALAGRWKRLAIWGVLGGVAGVYGWACHAVVWLSGHDQARPADAIVVFGAAQYSGHPSPVLRARLDHAIELYSRGLAPYLITTGGSGGDPQFSEGGVGRDYLATRGIGDRHLIAETQAENTAESAKRVAVILRANGMSSCIAVSDPYHLYRIKKLMEREGIVTYTSPRPFAYRSRWLRVAGVMREAASYLLWRMHVT